VVTGWDDVMAARYVSPGLTTVRQPMAELGRMAARAVARARSTGERSAGAERRTGDTTRCCGTAAARNRGMQQ
jgi:LacI family transcriptional regulator